MRRQLHRSFSDWVTIIGDGVVAVVAGMFLVAFLVAGFASGQILPWFHNDDDKR